MLGRSWLLALLPALLLGGGPARPANAESGCAAETGYSTDSAVLDELQRQFRPVLEDNRLGFAGKTGRVEGFGAGGDYPQVWLRDGATLLPAIRYHYGRDVLQSWLEEHLAQQGPSGELMDWLAPGVPGRFAGTAPRARLVYSAGGVDVTGDRNTTAADQEASAVDAAWSVFEVTGDRGWLAKPIAGTPLVDRLDAALASVLENRADPASGLVTSGFTADWGDVSTAHADQDALYLDDETSVVVGLYTNALCSRAAEELAAMHEAIGNRRRSGEWLAIADALRAAVNRRFWQEQRGFYRVHDVVLLRGPAPRFDDSDMFAMGGNALAVLYGVADARQSARIFDAAEARQRAQGLSSMAGVLLPPYPAGFFAHPLLREPFTYQNGGQWDWWAGRLLLAMFRTGHSEAARAQLDAVARRVSRAGGLYEWYTTDDQGRGSPRYAGNVGALSAALFQGLFGLDSRAGGLDVTVRLGAASGSVRTCEPATGRRIAYRYSVEPGGRRVKVEFEADAPGAGRLAVRLPGPQAPTAVLLDGVPIRHALETVGDEAHVVISTDWSPHSLELRLPPAGPGP